MNPKLRVLVRLDLDCTSARIEAHGYVTTRSVEALYVVARRTNSLMPGLALVIDVTHAWVEPEALERLHACSDTGHLPAHIDPLQSACRLSILDPAEAGFAPSLMGLAA